ncbi:WASH complex, subunit CCDC53 [Plasmopara halstedii]|uniref:WASH complex, subunit CCDC53 n=1 Tax=Plasmopara halstedii TaxID=4781 RepID=A0A0P1AU70_PLAHL|nr:WASH complex, subunit CCDC53 [Plasmopara halstedii]CEG44760.1 WASH complex, subunit CCDC53 [Plasmopara halstedii]|eukprot:XP_024581129.1 WASH complex, subunit CCDC53 [Plasmopara halstedii]
MLCSRAPFATKPFTVICKRRHAPAHRNYCIKLRMEQEAAEEEEEESGEEEDESNSESEEVTHASLSASYKASEGGIVRGLSPVQIKKLLKLATEADSVKCNPSIVKLQRQMSQLMADKMNGGTRRRGVSGSYKEIQALQLKFSELEKKTDSMVYAPQIGPVTTMSMNMPVEQIKSQMKAGGINSDLMGKIDTVSIGTPSAIFSKEVVSEKDTYIAMTVADDPLYQKYFKLKKLSMPVEQIKQKMKMDGVDPTLLDVPNSISPNDPGPSLDKSFGSVSNGIAPPYPLQMTNGGSSWPFMPAMCPAAPYEPLNVKDDPKLLKYFKLRKLGMPDEQIKLKMKADEIDPTLLDRPDDVSPYDLGSSAEKLAISSGPISMEQLISILMQYQHIIQQASDRGSPVGAVRSHNGSNFGALNVKPLPSVEDQMAQELAAAESAIDSIFGDDSQLSKGHGGLSMIEQLEKKARMESNKKLVENRKELEEYGLALGPDVDQTWSSRLLIKNKETRDWYFTEQERLDAGKAYGRLWGLSFLERDAGQLIAKRNQILNAPATMRAIVKGKPELIDKFTQLLKETVKLKHKIFKNSLYAAEVRRLQTFSIPERLEERGTELIDSTTLLAHVSMDLAEEEFRLLENVTRAKKLRAVAAVHVVEKAVVLVGIVKKIGANGVNETRLLKLESELARIKELYLSGEKAEEEEDDVL